MDELIRCPNCDSSIPPSEAWCPHCGAKQLPRRVMFGAKQEEFALTPDEESFELGDSAERTNWQFPLEAREEARERSAEPPPEALASSTPEIRWGGFFRRLLAILLDAVTIVLLAAFMALLARVAYKVGLSAYGRALNWQNAMPLVVLLSWSSIILVTVYFVLFHGMEGKTVGKWLLGLRVVGADRRLIGYRRAFLRSLAMVVALAPFGLGFLWVIWSREKRGWHDLLAGTWVIRD